MKRRGLFAALLTVALVVTVAPVAHAAAAEPPGPSSTADAQLAAVPPMGFNNWNAFGCEVNEALIQQTADVFVSSGLKDAGYEYVNIDDCWSQRERGADGRLVADPVKFPNGIRGVADYVHGKGLKLGIYGDAGTKTCAGYPGSLGHEELDARTWAEWGVDYLKYDNCNNQSDGSQADYIRRYTAMRDAIAAAGRPMVYSICEWGTSKPWTWANGVGQLWRTTGDISDNWPSLRSIIAQNAPLYPYAGPGHWNDPDMLEIGNGEMTGTEYRTHMSMWAMMAAPLIIGTDLRTASAETLAILGNRQIIAVDQDRLGVQGTVVSDDAGLMVLDKPLANGDHAIALYNSTDTLATVGVKASATGLRRAPAYRMRDLWTGGVLQAKTTISAAVPAHGTVVYRVRPLAGPHAVAPSVTVGAALATLVPGTGGATLSTTVTNRGAGELRDVAVAAQAPAGWTLTATTPTTGRRLRTDKSLAVAWTVGVPEGTPAGRYPIALTATYGWGPPGRTAHSESELVSTVVSAPADGNRHLSTVAPVDSHNARGPVEVDQGNGGDTGGDGSLITIAGRVYTRGLGTTTASEIRYYLGGRCSRLSTDVGIDDAAPSTVPATFTVYADETAAATSGPVNSGDAPRSLVADLTGATWLRLATVSGDAGTGAATAVQTDWAAPVLTCGGAAPDDPVLPESRTLFSFESGTDGWTTANPPDGEGVARSADFHTDGGYGLAVTTSAGGNWFGSRPAAPLDLSGRTTFKFDLRAGGAGTVGEIAVQVGSAGSWCQGGFWTWTNPGASRTVTRHLTDIDCPLGVTLDLSQVTGIWIFLNTGGVHHVDNLRVE
ncbi:NPCBM/NEW2 domain-containing protein [Actinoplanes sp. NPDC005259]|uniref:NPCBM/NEW2 domain-containing protein n=1 Tax=Actinoplanes sp. NPDC005259 TaxID=3154674 RepID=UPI00339F13CA